MLRRKTRITKSGVDPARRRLEQIHRNPATRLLYFLAQPWGISATALAAAGVSRAFAFFSNHSSCGAIIRGGAGKTAFLNMHF